MVAEDTYCIDVSTHASAVNKVLQSVAVGLLEQHCVADASANDPAHLDQVVGEATKAMERVPKS